MSDGADLELVEYLVERGVLPPWQPSTVEILSGGVSADVALVAAGPRRVVVKRALARLRVAREWSSSPTRVETEAAALEVARRILPANVPAVIDLDRERSVLVLECAPLDAVNWKRELLAGSIDPTLGGRLGAALALWHAQSAEDPEVVDRFSHDTHFFDLRISPFFLATAEVHRDLEEQIHAVVERMGRRRLCLVHGDFSPKNVLHGHDWCWVVDWETAHTGDPTFDLAFLVSHLVCKSVHRRSDSLRYRECARAFLDAYRRYGGVPPDEAGLVPLIGCLLLARVDGKSPVDYLDEDGRKRLRSLGRAIVAGERSDLDALWPDGPGPAGVTR